MQSILKLSLISSIWIISACTSILDAPTQVKNKVTISHSDSQWKAQLTQLKKIKSYQTKGQFGYISTQPKERFSSLFNWKYQDTQHFNFILSSSLSSQSLSLNRHPQGLTISDNKGRTRTGKDTNQLIKNMVGFSFPIEQFGDWLKGLPSATSDYIVNEKRQLSQFNYALNGQRWQVSYVAYHEDKQPNLPKLIILQNSQQTLKIRIDNWKY
ncbi:lipoprotein insertase outer membrane protein LolB [Pasteurella atlantica]|uniref:lipoprotein insertase outer membrane protein LolB n=1 Tax=Pasteurellaceae TaxID=712 RepID=UPI00276F50EE|nr:lipoprotein insertase outer membrane protein LolB [Pasteurella atlantica]MDP8032731.1 lipoprotein insertase outer membrane protein LolB [Pasteurella atlantica]MDP8034763.1 lipoprotein insertase outer membrane protein LolB [Pasteurella atlantica]MDP8036713.1 lipoprotein insertase outer membrane protein LolB [Pasteurella atlantica]MDP8046965.1 lipoprotein insertase outer membrane protein LolB [Pasteurella atlantica]MDP8048918.1 lipoprotein insertase outer membrane protein LolB [Pasteurella at